MSRLANRMTEAVTKLAATFASHAGESITYKRDGDPGVSVSGISATISRTPFEVSDGVVVTVYESRDYIVSADSLVDEEGSLVTPQAGDTITDSEGRVYEVAAPKPNNVYERMGPTGSVLKIHTKGPF